MAISFITSDSPKNAESGKPQYQELNTPEASERLTLRLRELLQVEHLLVMTGLGPSLSILDEGGNRVAPTMADLWADAKTIDGFDDVRAKVNYPEPGSNIEDFLSHCQLYYALNQDEQVLALVKLAEKMIASKCDFLDRATSLATHEAFLRRLGRRSTKKPRMKVFTTNYDLAYESAASSTNFVVIDGFSYSEPRRFDGSYFTYDIVKRDEFSESGNYAQNVIHLYKLHGSLNWEKVGGSIFRRERPEQPLVIYPRQGKFQDSYSQPYFEMMSRFQSALRQPNTALLVIGFGFNDEHLNEPIRNALRSNVGLKCAIADPMIDREGCSTMDFFHGLLWSGDHRLTGIKATFPELVEILPDLVPETDAEHHQKRISEQG